MIPPGTDHKVFNTGDVPLVMIAACAPAHDENDVVFTEPGVWPGRADPLRRDRLFCS